MQRFLLPAFALTCSLTACAGDDDGGEPGTDGGAGGPPPVTAITAAPDRITRQTAARFEFSSSIEGSTFTCQLDSAPTEPCASPFEVTVVDGFHRFAVFATSPSGNPDQTPDVHEWTVDTVAPVARLTQAPAALDNSEYPTFAFTTVDGDEATFGCKLDDRVEVACTSPWTPQVPVGKGAHTFTLIATDLAGNVQVVPTVHSWTADLALPDTVIDSGPTGTITTSDVSFTFSARNATPPVRFECRFDGGPWGPWAPCTSPFTRTGVQDALHTFDVRVIDANGLYDATPATRTFTIDTIGPYVEITSGPGATTSDTTPSFTFIFGSDAISVTCRTIHSGAPDPAFGPCTSPYTAAALPQGPTQFEVRTQDLAANARIASATTIIDTAPPVLTITSAPPALGTDNTPTFEFTAVGATIVQCRVDNAAWSACTSPHTTAVLTDSSHDFVVRAFDAAQNLAVASHAFAIDSTPPTVTFTGGPSNVFTADNTPTFTFTVSGAVSGGVTCRLGTAGDFTPCASPVTLPVTSDGVHAFNVRAVDGIGNVRVASRSFGINTAPMSITFTGGPTGATRDRSPLFTWTTTGAVNSTTCRHDAGVFASCATVMGTDLPDGPHTLEVRVEDDLGNRVNATVSFTVDTVAPTATFTGGPSGTISATEVSFSFDTAGAPTVTECRLFRTGQAGGAYAPCSSPHAVTLIPPSSPYSYTFEVRVTDAAGNQWSAYRSFTYSSN